MKIVQVTPRYPPRVGGVETHVKEISERLVERGHEVTVVTADAGKDVSNQDVRNGVRVRRCRGFAPGGAFHIAPGIVPVVRRSDGDIIHAHNYHSLPMVLGSLSADAPLIITPHYHGKSASGIRDHLLRAYRPVGKWSLHRATEVVAVSEWEHDLLQTDFDIDSTVVPNGLNLERFRDVTTESQHQPYLLYVGRLEEYKGVQHIIRSLKKIDAYNLMIVGNGPYRETLEDVAHDCDVRDRIQFTGYVSDDDLTRLYVGADVFITLSSFEAYGMTVGEALCSKTPCVVKESGALTQWVQYEGVIGVTNIEPDTIATAVEKARRNEPDTVNLMGWGAVTDQLETLYLK